MKWNKWDTTHLQQIYIKFPYGTNILKHFQIAESRKQLYDYVQRNRDLTRIAEIKSHFTKRPREFTSNRRNLENSNKEFRKKKIDPKWKVWKEILKTKQLTLYGRNNNSDQFNQHKMRQNYNADKCSMYHRGWPSEFKESMLPMIFSRRIMVKLTF